MTYASPKPCAYPRCRALTTKGAYCEAHQKQKQKRTELTRQSSTQRGYGYKWQKASKAYLKKHPFCECKNCQAGKLQLKPAEAVDHIIPHRGDMKLFWDRSNWQAINKQCHDKKTATEDGGFTGAPAKPKRGGDRKSTAFFL